MKYAHLEDKTNKLLGWYTDDVHSTWVPAEYKDIEELIEETSLDGTVSSTKKIVKKLIKEGYFDKSNIPTPNIEVTDDVWQDALSINANCYEDGAFIFKDFRTEIEIEESRILSIKAKANEIIESIYPTFKQLNIIRLGGNDLIEMGNFIDSIRTISNKAELNGTALEDINWTS